MSKLIRATFALFLCIAIVQVAAPSSAELNAPQAASWGPSDFSDSRSVSNFSALAWAVEEVNGQMFVGGRFLNVTNGNQTVAQKNLARFNLDGSWDSNFTPDVEDPVLSIAGLPEGSVVLGKEGGDYNGQSAGALVKIDPATGDIWPGWDTKIAGGTNVVREVTLEDDGWLYAVGTFTRVEYNGVTTPVTNVVRLDPVTGAPDTSWIPNVSGGSVWDVSVSKTNSSVYLAGWFTQAAGANNSVVGIDTNNATNATWTGFLSNQPGAVRKQYAIEATEFGNVWVGGVQHGLYVFDENQNMELAYNHITAYDSRFQANNIRRGGEFQEIERVGDRIYATCHCWGSHSSAPGPVAIPYNSNLANTSGTPTGSVSAVIAYDVQTFERDQSFNPFMAGDIGGFGVSGASDGCLWVAGGINAVGEPGQQKAGRDLVRLCDDGLGNGGGGGPQFEAPAECTATVDGANITVEWPAAAGAVDYVIRRTVNGNGPYWRGKVSGTSFVDTNISANLVYTVESKSIGGASSDPTECSFDPGDGGGELAAVAECTATTNGQTIDVTWPVANNAAEYVIRRTVNGNGPYWRGKVSGTSFSDANRDGSIVYSVTSKGADGTQAAPTTCSTEDGGGAAPQPVPNCSVTRNGGQLEVAWTPVAGADRYVIYREVNGGTRYWRGVADSPASSFDDTDRDGSLEYFVSSKFGAVRTDQVSCGSPA